MKVEIDDVLRVIALYKKWYETEVVSKNTSSLWIRGYDLGTLDTFEGILDLLASRFNNGRMPEEDEKKPVSVLQ